MKITKGSIRVCEYCNKPAFKVLRDIHFGERVSEGDVMLIKDGKEIGLLKVGELTDCPNCGANISILDMTLWGESA